MKTYNQLKEMFLTSNQALIRDDMDLLDIKLRNVITMPN